jgi:hypothetical protein
LQSVVLEYVTDRLVEEVSDEVTHNRPLLLENQPLIKARARDYVRQTEERLIGVPLLEHLTMHHGEAGTEQRLLSLLDAWRAQPAAQQGYGPGNGVNLLRLLRGNLRGVDLSRLAMRQVYLAEVDAQDASLIGAQLADAVLADAFNLPISVALSSDGALLAVGTSTGQIEVWRYTAWRCPPAVNWWPAAVRIRWSGCGRPRTIVAPKSAAMQSERNPQRPRLQVSGGPSRPCWATPARSTAWRCRPTGGWWPVAV